MWPIAKLIINIYLFFMIPSPSTTYTAEQLKLKLKLALNGYCKVLALTLFIYFACQKSINNLTNLLQALGTSFVCMTFIKIKNILRELEPFGRNYCQAESESESKSDSEFHAKNANGN